MFVSCVCCVFCVCSGFCDELVTLSEESYLLCVCVKLCVLSRNFKRRGIGSVWGIAPLGAGGGGEQLRIYSVDDFLMVSNRWDRMWKEAGLTYFFMLEFT